MRAGLGVGLALVIDEYQMVIHRWIGVSVVAAVTVQVASAAQAHPARVKVHLRALASQSTAAFLLPGCPTTRPSQGRRWHAQPHRHVMLLTSGRFWLFSSCSIRHMGAELRCPAAWKLYPQR